MLQSAAIMRDRQRAWSASMQRNRQYPRPSAIERTKRTERTDSPLPGTECYCTLRLPPCLPGGTESVSYGSYCTLRIPTMPAWKCPGNVQTESRSEEDHAGRKG